MPTYKYRHKRRIEMRKITIQVDMPKQEANKFDYWLYVAAGSFMLSLFGLAMEIFK